jgi:ParB family chromosome partitioning protein
LEASVIYADPESLVIIEDRADPLWDPRADLPVSESLKRNLGRLGAIEPIVARRRGDRTIVIDGRQRVRAARALNRDLRDHGSEPMKLPVVIRMAEDDGEVMEVAISANELRVDDSPLDRARKAARLHKLGRSLSEVAVAFGVSKAAVQSWWRLLELHPDVQQAVSEGRARVGEAVWEIGKLAVDKQPAALHDLEAARPTSKARGGHRRSAPRPGGTIAWRTKALARFIAEHADAVPAVLSRDAFTTVVLWQVGSALDSELVKAVPGLQGLVAPRDHHHKRATNGAAVEQPATC